MKNLWISFLLLSSVSLFAQNANDAYIQFNESLDVKVKKLQDPINLDGHLDEAIWKSEYEETNFWQFFPTDSVHSNSKTELMMAYDDDFLYIGVRCYSTGGDFVVPSLRRDYSFRGSDNFSIFFDTYKDKTNAFLFGINPYGVMREALLFNGGQSGGSFSMAWDNKWYGESAIYQDHWSAEMKIPFKALRFNSGSEDWYFNCYRNDSQLNEISSYARIPQNLFPINLAYVGRMEWEQPLEKTGTNISVIPYASANYYRDYEDPDFGPGETGFAVGGDAKVAISSGLNLDLTVNPDFSQVEVDQQVTNLTRFAVLFPERRQFFLENADLFSSFGLSRVNPFFTRRIGLDENGSPIPIRFGARLSGKVNDDLRIGLLNMQTGRQEENNLPGFNYSVAALQQKVFDRSNVSFIFVNKQATNTEESTGDYNAYNRIAGLEYRLLSKNNRWSGKFFHHQLFSPQETTDKFTQGLQLEYLRRRYRFEWAHLFVGQGFDAEVGFVPRRDYALISPEMELFWYPNGKSINQFGVNLDTRMIFNVGQDPNASDAVPDWGVAEKEAEMAWTVQFSNNTRASLNSTLTNLILLNDFDPTRVQKDPAAILAAGTKYTYATFSLGYASDLRQPFFFEINPVIGSFFNGSRWGVNGSLTYRFQPYGLVSVDFDFNRVNLAKPFEPVDIFLIGPRLDLTFTKKLFLSTFVQYNSQFDNMNINTRLQWRYAPVSDLFIVYTDNYLTAPFSQFGVRNRALTAKVTYWLNL